MAYTTSELTGPPVPPPTAPSVTALGAGEPVPAAKGEAIVKLFYEVEKTLDTIASSAPKVSEEIDKIKEQLRDVMVTISNGGASGTPRPQMPGTGAKGPY